MAKKNKRYNKPEDNFKSDKIDKQATQISDKQFNKKKNLEKLDLLDNVDGFFQKHQDKFFYISLILTFIISIVLFNFRVSISGDDASYILRASDFIKDFKYPGFQGPLYPIVLSPLILLFGINLIILKALSLLFMLGFILFFYKSFKNRVSPFILSLSLILFSINHLLLYFSSQTYSEALFLFLQALLFYVFFKFFIDRESNVQKKENFKRHFLLAVCLLALGLTRNIGNLAFGVVLLYFIIQREWKNSLYITLSFAAVLILFQGIKFLLWGDAGLQFVAQGNGLLNKNYYDPTAGYENISGFINRFLENSNTYIFGSFIALLGFWLDAPPEKGATAISVIYYLLFFTGIIIVLRKNKFLFFTGLYTISFLVTTFIILQTIWSQLRIIIPFYPLMLIFLLSTIYYLVRIKKFSKLKLIAILFPFVILATTSFKTKEYSNKMSHSQDVYDGFTPDWVNYIKASKWSAENIPKEENIACRKPTISFIYGKGRHFLGIDHVPSYSIESLILEWSKNKNKYIAVKSSDLSKKNFDYFAKTKLNEKIIACVTQEKGLFFIFEEPLYEKVKFYSELNTTSNKQIKDVGQFKNLLTKKAEVFYPDSLVRNLCRSKIQYILAASLRANVEQKDKVQNTINRYIIFIRFRYPNMFSDVMNFGDEEPTKLVKINYENYKLPFCK